MTYRVACTRLLAIDLVVFLCGSLIRLLISISFCDHEFLYTLMLCWIILNYLLVVNEFSGHRRYFFFGKIKTEDRRMNRQTKRLTDGGMDGQTDQRTDGQDPIMRWFKIERKKERKKARKKARKKERKKERRKEGKKERRRGGKRIGGR